MSSLFETEHAQLARRLADKLGGVYGNEQISCELWAHRARILVDKPNEKHERWRGVIEETERGLVTAMLLRVKDGTSEIPVFDETAAELEIAIDKLIAERGKA